MFELSKICIRSLPQGYSERCDASSLESWAVSLSGNLKVSAIQWMSTSSLEHFHLCYSAFASNDKAVLIPQWCSVRKLSFH